MFVILGGAKNPRISLLLLHVFVLALALVLSPGPAHAQGCAQCQDTTAATTPATQSAYRHAILLMSTAAGTFFLATLLILKRHR